MVTKTFLWTRRTGQKIPITLMDDSYLINAYSRCMEIVMSHQAVSKMERFKQEEIDINNELIAMSYSIMTPTEAGVWAERFIDEAARRKLKLPNIKRHDLEKNYKEKVSKKTYRINQNDKFDDKFKP